MTIYFQGSETEAFPGQPSISTSGDVHDFGFTRAAIAGGTALTHAALTDFWITFTAINGQTIFEANHVFATFRDLAGNPMIQLKGVEPGGWAIFFWDGAAWQHSGVGTMGGIWANRSAWVIHIRLGPAGSSIVECWKDGNTQPNSGASPNLSAIANLSSVDFLVPRGVWHYSQIVISDKNLLLWALKTLPPKANGMDTQGAGAVSDINEVGIEDLTYVEFTAPEQKRSVTLDPVTLPRHLKGVTVSGRLMRIDDEGPQKARPYLVLNGVRFFGPAVALTTGWLPYQYTWGVNPATGGEWLASEINAAGMESGWEAVA